MRYLDIYISLLASAFFTYHIFGGSLGLWANYKYQSQLHNLKEALYKAEYEGSKLLYYNQAFSGNIHPDYLETLLLKHLYKIPNKSRIIKI